MTVKTILAITAFMLPASMAFAQTEPADPSATDPAAGADVGADVGAQADAGTTADTSATDTQAAASADIQAGATVHDPSGGVVGTIEKVEGQTAILSTGSARVGLPVSGIGKNDRGLVIALTKAEVEAAAEQNSANN